MYVVGFFFFTLVRIDYSRVFGVVVVVVVAILNMRYACVSYVSSSVHCAENGLWKFTEKP